MDWLINLFGPLGERTKGILKAIGAVLLFIRPLLAGQVPGLDWPGFPVLVPAIDWLIGLLVTLGIVAFADKFSPARNLAVFGEGTRPIAPTVEAVAEVVSVPASPATGK